MKIWQLGYDYLYLQGDLDWICLQEQRRKVWRPAECPEDEGQFEAAARRRDAREGWGE